MVTTFLVIAVDLRGGVHNVAIHVELRGAPVGLGFQLLERQIPPETTEVRYAELVGRTRPTPRYNLLRGCNLLLQLPPQLYFPFAESSVVMVRGGNLRERFSTSSAPYARLSPTKLAAGSLCEHSLLVTIEHLVKLFDHLQNASATSRTFANCSSNTTSRVSIAVAWSNNMF